MGSGFNSFDDSGFNAFIATGFNARGVSAASIWCYNRTTLALEWSHDVGDVKYVASDGTYVWSASFEGTNSGLAKIKLSDGAVQYKGGTACQRVGVDSTGTTVIVCGSLKARYIYKIDDTDGSIDATWLDYGSTSISDMVVSPSGYVFYMLPGASNTVDRIISGGSPVTVKSGNAMTAPMQLNGDSTPWTGAYYDINTFSSQTYNKNGGRGSSLVEVQVHDFSPPISPTIQGYCNAFYTDGSTYNYMMIHRSADTGERLDCAGGAGGTYFFVKTQPGGTCNLWSINDAKLQGHLQSTSLSAVQYPQMIAVEGGDVIAAEVEYDGSIPGVQIIDDSTGSVDDTIALPQQEQKNIYCVWANSSHIIIAGQVRGA